MPRYLVERSIADGLRIPIGNEGERIVSGVVERNAAKGGHCCVVVRGGASRPGP